MSSSKISVIFDENIKLDDASNKFVVSPAQKQNPVINANGRRLTVELRDTMLPNTTYTLDFSDAIRDLNEGNILDGFALDFSTGDEIDTLQISGMLFQARNLEPAQGMVVGVYSNLSDTAISTLPLERVAKTNQYGQFTIRNLKPGTYNIFAIDDRNHDWHWDRSESVAFGTVSISPSVEEVMVSDTLRSSLGEDSIVMRQAWHYLPDDVLLTWFNENYSPQYLREYERTDRQRATFKFGAKSDTLPEIRIINGPREGSLLSDLSVLEARPERDSLVYWIRDTLVTAQDSLLVAARYLKTDSLEQLSWTTDTLRLFVRGNIRQTEKNKAKELEKRIEELRKKEKDGEDIDSAMQALMAQQIIYLDLKAITSNQQELHKPAVFEVSQPVESIDSAGWRLEMAVDTLWVPVPEAQLVQDTAMVRRYNLSVPWQQGERYRFTADSLAIVNIYGQGNKPFKHEFKVKPMEEYGTITFAITDLAQLPDSVPVVVELLSQADAVVDAVPVVDGTASFTFVAPATYYARAYIDANGNSQWDTGNVSEKLQPEDVFYFTKKLALRKNWDIDQEWALFETPVDAQKPNEIKKNKPKTRDKDKNRGANRGDYEDEDEEYEDDEGFGQGGYYDGGNAWGNGSQYNNARRNNSSSGTSGRRNNSNMRRNNSF